MKKTLRLKESELIDLIEDTVKNNIKKPKPLSENKVRLVKTRLAKWSKLNEGKSPKVTFDSFHKECHKLKSHGYSEEVISEALKKCQPLNEAAPISSDGAMNSIWNSVREGFYGWVLEKFGATGETKLFLRTVLGNVPIWDLPQLLMNCNVLVSAIVKGLPEYVIGWVGRSTLFGGQDTNLGLLLQNSLADWLDDTSMYQGIEQKIRDMICNGHKVKVDKLQGMFDQKAAATPPPTPSSSTGDAGGTDGILNSLLSQLMGKMGGK
tara:strand:- start:1040 stop:1834 length:795 start_codon:yes stop_codon:yes gene_type:complete